MIDFNSLANDLPNSRITKEMLALASKDPWFIYKYEKVEERGIRWLLCKLHILKWRYVPTETLPTGKTIRITRYKPLKLHFEELSGGFIYLEDDK